MSSTAPHFPRARSLSPSSSPSSTSTSDEPSALATHAHRTAVAPGYQFPAMDYGHDSGHWHSTPNLGQQLDGSNNSSQQPPNAARMLPPRTHSYGTVGSQHFAQPHIGQTWIDFLRDSGADPTVSVHQPQPHPQPNVHAPLPPLPSDLLQNLSSPHYALPARPLPHAAPVPSRTSSDRKRRLTTADSPFRRPSSIRMHSGGQAGPSENHMAASGSSNSAATPQRPSLQTQLSMTRRDSDLVLPHWQPDSEVTHCFVCGSQFTFFYRKHHCRKCGRVVCSACSPHRITIPRQYIVHPPNDNPNIIDLTYDDDDRHMSRFGPYGSNPALGGGEEVRVCNPCVPDPNYSPPPQHGQTSPFPPFSPSAHSPHLPPPSTLPRGSRSSHRSTQSVNDSARTSHGRTSRSHDVFTDRRTSYHGSSRVADLWPPTQTPSHGYVQHPGYEHHTRSHSRSMHSSSSIHPHVDPGHNMTRSRHSSFAPGPPLPAPAPAQPQPTPRRQIAEEDECPVCGNELPPKGPNGDETARTEHVQECIALHSGSPPPAAPTNTGDQTSTSLPSQRTRGMSSAAGNGEGSSNRASVSMRGLVPYTATEKDCVDEEGQEAECVICFEEIVVGAKMARLVCWCKFHEHCIRGWWEMKGKVACPTHMQY